MGAAAAGGQRIELPVQEGDVGDAEDTPTLLTVEGRPVATTVVVPFSTLEMRAVVPPTYEPTGASRVFARAGRSQRLAGRSQRFLRYLVAAVLAAPPRLVKEYTVATEVFDRDPATIRRLVRR